MALPTLHVFSESPSPRLDYVLHTVFRQRLGIAPVLVHNWESFANSAGARFNYSERPFQGAQVWPQGLLHQRGIEFISPEAEFEGTLPLIFPNQSALGHDALAACFVLLSRYEEYLETDRDAHGRFTGRSSWLMAWNAVQVPLVDCYVRRLAHYIESTTGLKSNAVEAKMEVSFDADRLFAFKAQPAWRTGAALLRDSLIHPTRFFKRAATLLGFLPDPLDVLLQGLNLCQPMQPSVFIQVGGRSSFDMPNIVSHKRVIERIRQLASRATIGVHPSYEAATDGVLFAAEQMALQNVLSKSVEISRQHYLRIRLPGTYRTLARHGIKHDYSMGFADVNGFRASTSLPFLFYDLEAEMTTGLQIHPFAFSDLTAMRTHGRPSDVKTEMQTLHNWCLNTGGCFHSLWHPEALAGIGVDEPSWPIFQSLMQLHQR